jgi:hypothetical protein
MADLFIPLPWNDRQAVEGALHDHGSDVAAVITEPVMCNCGVISPHPSYLHPDPLECLYISTAHSNEDIEFTIEAAHEAAKAISDTPWVPMPQAGAGQIPPQRLTKEEVLAFGDKLLALRSTLSPKKQAFLDEILVRAAAAK